MVTRRPTLLPLCLLVALAASLTSACVIVVEHGPDRASDTHFRSGSLGGRLEVWSSGDLDFATDDASVARITPGGFLRIEERQGLRTRRVMVEARPAGALVVTHTVNGRDQSDDEENREELARLFRLVVRRTAVGAERRVGRLLARSGVTGVLDELDYLVGSSANTRYLTELLRQGNLGAAGLVLVADQARRRISSSDTRARFLIEAKPYYLPASADQATALDAYFAAIASLSSSTSHARVLLSLLDERPDHPTLSRVLSSARSISSGGTKSRVLVSAVAYYGPDADVRRTFFEAADSLSSSSDQARVLMALLDGSDLDLASTVSLLQSAEGISSSDSRGRVLAAAARGFRNEPAPRDAFLNATASMSSSDTQARVLVHLLSTAVLDDAAVVEVLRAATGISSSSGQGRVLIAASERVGGNSELLSVYLDVARGISSSDERRRVLAAIGRTST